MNLDQAMLFVAQQAPHRSSADDLTAWVRSRLVSLLTKAAPGSELARGMEPIRNWLHAAWSGSSDPAGELYQELVKRTIHWDGQDLVVRRERGAHRATGAYYTGEHLVDYVFERVAHYLPNVRRVIDPACGSGAFLAGALRRYRGQLEHIEGIDRDSVAADMCRRAVPEANVIVGDSLLMPAEPGDFDLCIGNPPFIGSGLRGSPALDSQRQQELRTRYSASAQYKLNTYPMFVEYGLGRLREGGVLAYVLPDSFLAGRYFAQLRGMLLCHRILELTLVAHDFWVHGKVGQTVILLVQKGTASYGHTIRITVAKSLDKLKEAYPTEVPQADVVWGALSRFRLIPSQQIRQMVRHMESVPGVRPLGAYVRSYSGLIGRGGQRSLLRSSNPVTPGPWRPLLRSGSEIDRYRLSWAGEEVCLRPELIKSGGNVGYYANPKLLLRQTADSLRAVFDGNGFFCLNNIHLLVPRHDGVNLRTVLGVLNSTPVNEYYRAVAMETKRLYAQVDLDLLESIPIPPLAADTADDLSQLVVKRETAASHEAAALDLLIDERVARLYGLAVV